MANEATTAPAQENTAVTEQTVKEELVARNHRWMTETAVQKMGKGRGTEHTVLIPLPNETPKVFLARFGAAVGEANFEKEVMKEVVRQACRDAERDAEAAAKKAGKEGQYTLAEWFECVCKWFIPGARQSGDGVKQIREQLAKVMKEMEPLMTAHLKKETRDKMTPDEVNRLLQLMAEFSELSEKEEGKSRQGKKGAKAPATAAK